VVVVVLKEREDRRARGSTYREQKGTYRDRRGSVSVTLIISTRAVYV
jgi:hypothetical protein